MASKRGNYINTLLHRRDKPQRLVLTQFRKSKTRCPSAPSLHMHKGWKSKCYSLSANGILHWIVAEKVRWAVVNDFLTEVSTKVSLREPETEAVFLFDNAPAHRRAEQAALAANEHTVKRLPPCSPFFNPIEELFSKFKAGVKGFLTERRDGLLTTTGVISKKEHRRILLAEAAGRSKQHIQRVECAAYDRHNYTFVQAALNCRDI
ncbi:hypothetical protein MTO96_046972 [Rhipicephalus appendiculatus]